MNKNIINPTTGNIKLGLLDAFPEPMFVATGEMIVMYNAASASLFSFNMLPCPVPEILKPFIQKFLHASDFFNGNETEPVLLQDFQYYIILIYPMNEDHYVVKLSSFHKILPSVFDQDQHLILKTFLELAPDPVFITDLKGKIVTCNRASSALSPTNNHLTLIGTDSLNWLKKKEKERAKAILQELLEKGTISGIEFEVIENTTGIRFIEMSASVLFNFSGTGQILVILKDITQRKDHEAKTIESEAKFKQLTENIDDCCWLFTATELLYVNPAFEKIWEKETASFYANSNLIFDSIEKQNETAPNFRNYFGTKFQGTIITDEQFYISRPNGENRCIWFRLFPITNQEGIITRMVGLASDITPRIELEQSLRENEERFRSLVTFSEDSYAIYAQDKSLKYISPSIKSLTGYTEEEVKKIDPNKLIHKDDIPLFIGGFQRAVNEPFLPVIIEYRLRKKNNAVIFVETLISNQISNPLIEGMVLHTRNIDKRKTAERELYIAKERAELIYKVSPSAIFTVDLDKNITSWNNKAEEITGYTAEEVLNKPCVLFNGTPCNEICRMFTSGNFIKDSLRECTIRTKSGETKFISKNMDFLRDHSGNIIGGVESFEDITLEKKRLKEIIDAKNKAEASDKLKSAFLANMSHEIRTPMNGILGFTELLKQPDVSESEKAEFLEVITASGNHLLNLINDIIDLSKLEAGQLKIKSATFNLNNLISDILIVFQKEIQSSNKDVELIFDFLAYPDLEVETDKNRLQQILTNIIGNAIKFTLKGSVEISYALDDTTLSFKICDTGIGIKQEDQYIIFNRFSQIDGSDTRKFGGTGLGLAIVKGIIDLMGGKIWLDSKFDEGTTFYFSLPAIKSHSPHKNTIHPKPKPLFVKDWHNRVIVIVEDDKMSYVFLKKIIAKNLAQVVHFQDGAAAVSYVEQNNRVDLILMDIQLPVMNGLEATRRIKQLRPQLPIIAQTANAMLEHQALCMAAGCDDYVSKPVNSNLLCDKIDAFLKDRV